MIAPGRPVIGVDAGGSVVRARLRGSQDTVRLEHSGNLLRGSDAVLAIASAVATVCDRAGLHPEHAVVAVAAAGDTPLGRRRLASLSPRFAHLAVVSDVVAAALGAHAGKDGAAIVLGTGAAGCVVTAGRVDVFGGWGLAVDDCGSGADIGRAAVRATLRTHDGDVPVGPLSEVVAQRLGREVSGIVEWAHRAEPKDFAALAPSVFDAADAADPVAIAILTDATAALARLAAIARSRGATRIAVAGSVGQRLRNLPDAPTGLLDPLSDALEGACLALSSGVAEPVGSGEAEGPSASTGA